MKDIDSSLIIHIPVITRKSNNIQVFAVNNRVDNINREYANQHSSSSKKAWQVRSWIT